jgi:WD40 repeat protein
MKTLKVKIQTTKNITIFFVVAILFNIFINQTLVYSIPLERILAIAKDATVKIKHLNPLQIPGEGLPIIGNCKEIICEINPLHRGTGTIISRSNTSYFVVTTAKTVEVEPDTVEMDQNYEIVGSSPIIKGKVRYQDISKIPGTDLVIMKFNNEKEYSYPIVKIGDSSTLNTGDKIFIAGFSMPSKSLFEPILEFETGEVNDNNSSINEISYSSISKLRVGGEGGGIFNINGELIGIRLPKNVNSESGNINNSHRALKINSFIKLASESGISINKNRKKIISEALPLTNMSEVIGINKKFILTGSYGSSSVKNFQIWQKGGFKPLIIIPYDISDRITDMLSMSADGKTFAAQRSIDNEIEVLILKNDRLQPVKKLAYKDDIFISSLSISSDGKTLVAGGLNKSSKQRIIEVWNIQSGKLLNVLKSRFPDSDYNHFFATVSDNGNTVIGIDNSNIEIWSLPKGEVLKTIAQQTYNVRAVALDGSKLLLSDKEGSIEEIQLDYTINELM